MNILACGDSFTFGLELEDLAQSWPHVLASKCPSTITNLAEPGASNDRIVRKTLDYLVNTSNPRPDLVVVAWTLAGRMEMADEMGTYDIWPGVDIFMFGDNTHWRRNMAKYLSQYHDSVWFVKRYYQQILLLQAYLLNQNLRFVFLNVTQNDYYKLIPWQDKVFFVEQINKEYFLEFDKSGMIEWTQNCARGPGGHFLEQGHQIVADKIYEHIRNLGWLP
jgi:hypothetical protein